MVDSTSFLQGGNIDFGLGRTASQIIDASAKGTQSKIIREERDRQKEGRKLMEEAIEFYKNNDIRGFTDKLNTASQYVPNEAKDVFTILGSTNKSNMVEIAHHLLAAATFKPDDIEGIHSQIDRAIEVANPQSPLGIELASMKKMNTDDLSTAITNSVAFSQAAGLLPGVEKADPYASRKLAVQEGNLLARLRELRNDEDAQQWKEEVKEFEKNFGKLPEGLKRDPEDPGKLISMPGSKIREQRTEAKRVLLSNFGNQMRKSELARKQISDLINKADWTTAGIVGSVLRYIPGSKARDFEEVKHSIVANIGFDRLQEMRDASKTGGALGNVSELELQALQKSITSLEQAQSPSQLKKNLQIVFKQYNTILEKAQLDFKDLRGRNVDDLWSGKGGEEAAMVGVENNLEELPIIDFEDLMR